MQITQSDVERLARASSPRVRVEVAGKIAQGYTAGTLASKEREVAVEIFRLLMRDAEVKVRAALSFNLKNSSDVPRDIILRLAQDIQQVSVPVLEFSTLLTDEDLVAIVESSHEIGKLTAIARRETVNEYVAQALLGTYNDAVAETLFTNQGASIPEESMLSTISRLASNESVIDALMHRGGLSATCVEKIFLCVSEHMKKRLIEQHHFSRHLLEGRIEYSREWATLGIIGQGQDADIEALVSQMHSHRRLTSSVVLRSLCVGDLRFFEYALAKLTGVNVDNVRKLMLDSGPLGFRSLYKASPLPPSYYDAVKKLLDIVLHETQNGRKHPENFCQRVVDNVISNGYDLSIEYMPLLLAIIKGNASEPASIH